MLHPKAAESGDFRFAQPGCGSAFDTSPVQGFIIAAGMAQKTGDPLSATVQAKPTPTVEATTGVTAVGEVAKAVSQATPVFGAPKPVPASTDNKAEEILAMIRARQQK